MEPGTEVGTDLTADVDLAPRSQHVDLHDPRIRAEVERTVCSVPGVVGARLVPGFDRHVDELHVLTTLDKQPKQAVRDVQTVLMARFGVPTDHRVVSVVQLDERDGLPNATRVVIDRVAVSQSGMSAAVEVVLRDGDERYPGQAEGSSSSSGRHRTVARATIEAVRPLLADDALVELEGVEIGDVAGRRVAVALVHLRTARSELVLSGSAVVRDAEPDAVAKAVLDALNRTVIEDR